MKLPFLNVNEQKLVIEPTEENWCLGDLVNLHWNDKLIKNNGQKSYAYCAVSNYVCVREATDDQCGILVKVLGKLHREHIMFVKGAPYCKDKREDLFIGKRYYCYPFPALDALKEVLQIVGSNQSLISRFQTASMKYNVASSFWVRESAGNFLTKTPQYYDAGSAQLHKATDNTAHYRLSIVYFKKN